MSILSQAINAYKAGTPLSQVISTFITQTEGWAASLINKAQSDPAVATAVNTAVTDLKTAGTNAISWAETAIASELSAFGDELAGLVVKYGTRIAGLGAPVGAATTLVGALVDVGVATVQHEALALQNTLTNALQTPAAPAAPSVPVTPATPVTDPQQQAGA